MFGCVGREVEIAADDRGGRSRREREGLAGIAGLARRAGVLAGLDVQSPQRVDLRDPLPDRVVLEVRRRHPDRSGRRLDHGLDGDTLHAGRRGIGGPGQQVPEHLADGQPREDRVAEEATSAAAVVLVGRGAEEAAVPGERRTEPRHLVLAGTAGQVREADRDFLQAQHVEVGEVTGLADDALGVDAAVDAAAPLDVPGDQFHGGWGRPGPGRS